MASSLKDLEKLSIDTSNAGTKFEVFSLPSLGPADLGSGSVKSVPQGPPRILFAVLSSPAQRSTDPRGWNFDDSPSLSHRHSPLEVHIEVRSRQTIESSSNEPEFDKLPRNLSEIIGAAQSFDLVSEHTYGFKQTLTQSSFSSTSNSAPSLFCFSRAVSSHLKSRTMNL